MSSNGAQCMQRNGIKFDSLIIGGRLMIAYSLLPKNAVGRVGKSFGDHRVASGLKEFMIQINFVTSDLRQTGINDGDIVYTLLLGKEDVTNICFWPGAILSVL